MSRNCIQLPVGVELHTSFRSIAAGNPVCRQPQYRLAIAAALPRLKLLDGQPVRPGEALQYLAALQLQAFQPPPLALPQQQQQKAETSPGADAWGGTPARQQAAADPLQRIQRVLASFAGKAGPSNLKQQRAGEAVHGSGSSPEDELHDLLRGCPQLADVISSALAGAQPPGKQPSSAQQQAGAAVAPSEQLQGQACPMQLVCSAAQTEPAEVPAAVAVNAAAADKKVKDELQQQVAALQDEVAALQAELEVATLAAQHAQQDAAAAAQQAQQQALEAARAADVQASEARLHAAGAVEQAERKLHDLQVCRHCPVSFVGFSLRCSVVVRFSKLAGPPLLCYVAPRDMQLPTAGANIHSCYTAHAGGT